MPSFMIDEKKNLVESQGFLLDERKNLVKDQGYVIDEKKNLVEYQGGGGDTPTPPVIEEFEDMIKETYDFIMDGTANLPSYYINGTFSNDVSNLLTKISSNNFIMAKMKFNITSMGWQSADVNPIIGGSFLVGDLYIVYMPYKFNFSFSGTTNCQLNFMNVYESDTNAYTDEMFATVINGIKNMTGTLTLYLES